MNHIPTFEQFLNEGIQVKDFFKDSMNAADARGWIFNIKMTDEEKKEKIK